MLGIDHHSIMRDPDTGQYWIAYHRFVTPLTRFSDYKAAAFSYLRGSGFWYDIWKKWF
jgi:hypothetical protein